MKAIEGNPKNLREILQCKGYEIPDFQRKYSWGNDECSQLFEDIKSFLDGDEKESEKYFVGSIVVYPKNEDKDILCVIDGQQRLTTLVILISILFERDGTNKKLEELIYRSNILTGEINREYPKIISQVIKGGQEEEDQESLKKKLFQQ